MHFQSLLARVDILCVTSNKKSPQVKTMRKVQNIPSYTVGMATGRLSGPVTERHKMA